MEDERFERDEYGTKTTGTGSTYAGEVESAGGGYYDSGSAGTSPADEEPQSTETGRYSYGRDYSTGSSGTYGSSGSAYSSGSSGSGYPSGPSGYSSYNGNGSRPRKKGNRKLAMVLAVIMVFVLGAGAGAYVSGRGATAALSESESGSRMGSAAEADPEAEAVDGAQETEEEDSYVSAKGTGSVSHAEAINGTQTVSDGTVADVAEQVMPAIVSVYNKYTEESQFWGQTYTQEAESTGSGIIIEETEDELLIVTNNHVVEGADSLSVQFIDEENCEAALKGTDASSDLAVISVPLSSLSSSTLDAIAIAELGDSDSLRIGEQVIAIGNALGIGQSLTVGYVSALNREVTSENGITGTFIQTDAAINPGNSGGALLNTIGQVIGINSNKIGGTTVEGMGFAIPISKAIPIIDELKLQESRTKVSEDEQGVIGIYGMSVTSDVASAYGLPIGAYVEEINPGSGAEKSDLMEGDIITAINGQTITSMEDLSNQLAYYSAGTEVTLTVQHPMEGGEYEEREIAVTLSRRSDLESESTGEGGRQQNRIREEDESSEEGGSGFFQFPFGF